jgi:cytoskeletal protein CcmA (bactofilin family)
MSFFRRDDEDPTTHPMTRSQPSSPGGQPAGTRERAVTRIAGGTRISGEVTGATELLVEGEVEGHVRVDSRVVVGQGGMVRGQISARSVVVAGTVDGNVRGSDRVEVGGSGKLQGDIAAPRVTIAEGAFFKGKVEMGGGEGGRRSQPAPRPPAPPPSTGGSSSPGLFPERGGEGSEPGSSSSGGGEQ